MTVLLLPKCVLCAWKNVDEWSRGQWLLRCLCPECTSHTRKNIQGHILRRFFLGSGGASHSYLMLLLPQPPFNTADTHTYQGQWKNVRHQILISRLICCCQSEWACACVFVSNGKLADGRHSFLPARSFYQKVYLAICSELFFWNQVLKHTLSLCGNISQLTGDKKQQAAKNEALNC